MAVCTDYSPYLQTATAAGNAPISHRIPLLHLSPSSIAGSKDPRVDWEERDRTRTPTCPSMYDGGNPDGPACRWRWWWSRRVEEIL